MSSSSAGPIDVDVDGSDALSSFTHAWLIQNILSDATASVQRSLLYAAYVVDCQSNALVPLNEIGFGRVLRSSLYTLKWKVFVKSEAAGRTCD
jgi:hypothetical protein